MNPSDNYRALDALQFDNRFTAELPADSEQSNNIRQVRNACYSRVQPVGFSNPELVAFSREMAAELDLSSESCLTLRFTEVFSGNRLLPEMDPYATCYGGHQFGQWAGQLGDGRAINLGEVINRHGKRWALQLKGAGPTPYSRMADGLAVLRSSLREFLCSEAMHHLGVPTTRALSLMLTGETVTRDMFYDGRPKAEPGAVVCRTAPSFTRFGNFQILTAQGDTDLLRRFTEYTLRTDFNEQRELTPKVITEWFTDVCRRTAIMICHWMRVGFVHGVMNTDNMSILGLTIDYGPYGWLEDYDPGWTPNTTDASGRRYCYGRQPEIGLWNLVQLANSLLPMVEQVEPLQQALEVYSETFVAHRQQTMAAKLGLKHYDAATDDTLTTDLHQTLKLAETDMTVFYRRLGAMDITSDSFKESTNDELLNPLMDAFYQPEQLSGDTLQQFADWLKSYRHRMMQDGSPYKERRQRMDAVNPKYVLRNYLAQMAIDKVEQGDNSLLEELMDTLRHPYDEQPDKEQFAAKRPEWARHRAGCSMLSCSS
ncbi:protein adenylyltransferase SelO [Spongorhabdus nitratireducens]